MANEFRIRILIDGQEAEKQAIALRGKINKAITSTSAGAIEKIITTEDARAAGKERHQAAIRETVELRAQVKERQRLQRLVDQQAKAQERLTRQEGTARQLAAQLGIQWDTYIQKAVEAGTPLEEIVGTLRRIGREQGVINREADRYGKGTRQMGGRVAQFGRNLSQARMEAHGLHMVLGDLNNATRQVQFASTALVGSLTLAGREYIQLARQTDVASRSLMLSEELTQQLRREVMQMSADLALVDPQQTAEGVTLWAQATGQAIDNQADLNTLLQQTVPLQQLAALSQESLGAITDGTAASLRQFGLDISETDRVVAIFSKVADDTLASVGDMAEAMKYVGPQAHEMGEGIEDTSAVLGLMADANIRGSTAGRAYRQMLISLIDPSKKAKDALGETFGDPQPFYDAQGQFVGMAQVIDMLAAATENATDEERELLLSTMFTSNALPGVTALVQDQIEARKVGINVIRAEAKLLEGTIDAEVEAYATLRREADGVSITMMGAMDVWERQLSDWEKSDVYRVQQMEMRWKGFWLSIGESAVNFAIPYIERASVALEKVTSLVSAHPELGALVAVGAGGMAIATIMRVVLSTVRTVHSLKAISVALEKTTAQQVTAGTKFQGQIVSAAERFSSIIVAAAEKSAAVEEAGAGAEVAVESEGAVAEAAIENEGAVAEAVIENEGAVVEAAIENTGAIAEAAIEVASAAGLIAAVIALPPLLALAIIDAISRTELGEKLGVQSAGKYVSVAAYGLGTLLGGTEMGEEWFTSTATAMGEIGDEADQTTSSLSSLDEMLMGLGKTGIMLPMVLQDYTDAAGDASTATDILATDLYELGDSVANMIQFTEKEEKAIDLYVEMLRKQEEALDSLNDALADALADLNAELADMDTEFASEIKEIRDEARESEVDAERKFRQQQTKNHEAHIKRLRRMEENHLLKMVDLARTRDAYGMMKEKQRHDLARARAVEDYEGQAGERAEEFRRQQDERRRQADERIAEMRVEHEAEKAERIAAYEEQREQLLAEHGEDMARLESEYFDKINAELEYWKQSAKQQNDWMAAMLADANIWLGHKRDLWLDYVRNLPTPQYGAARGRRGGEQEYQHGGYTIGGIAHIHPGEFVLDPKTTAAAESLLGPLTQARLVDGLAGGAMGGGGGNATIRATMHLTQDFSFVGAISVAERQWFRQMARSEAEEGFRDAMRGVIAMRGG